MDGTGEGPLVVGIGGTARPGSTTDRALRIALDAARGAGARTACFGGRFIAGLPIYEPHSPIRTPDTRRLLQAVRGADGLLVATPGYHGGVSGVVKNALDFLEDLRDDPRSAPPSTPRPASSTPAARSPTRRRRCSSDSWPARSSSSPRRASARPSP